MMRFAGEYIDTATSLYHLRARQYDPAVGRFLATDPVTQPLSDPYVSTYVYADNQPTVLVDPSGLDSDSPSSSCGGGRATATAVGAAHDAATGWSSRYTGVSHGMRSSDAAIRSRAARALPSAGASRFARSAGFRAVGKVLPGVGAVAEYAHARCQGKGTAQAVHRAAIASAVGTAGTASAAAVCAIPEIATLGAATPLCAAGVATAGATAAYAGGKAADLAWSGGRRLGEALYDLFG
jgi:RHS repeat-associated protein